MSYITVPPCDGGHSSMRKLTTFGGLATLPKQSGKWKPTPHHVPFHFFCKCRLTQSQSLQSAKLKHRFKHLFLLSSSLCHSCWPHWLKRDSINPLSWENERYNVHAKSLASIVASASWLFEVLSFHLKQAWTS